MLSLSSSTPYIKVIVLKIDALESIIVDEINCNDDEKVKQVFEKYNSKEYICIKLNM